MPRQGHCDRMGLHPLQAGDLMLQAGVVGHHCLQLHCARFQLQNLGRLPSVCIFQHTCKCHNFMPILLPARTLLSRSHIVL